MRTADLTGATLDWAVARAQEGEELADGWHPYSALLNGQRRLRATPYAPSTDWSQGGPIIEREGILLRAVRREGHGLNGMWLAMYDGANTGTMVTWVQREDWPRHYLSGPTPLIAAMRCYVASNLGDEVDVPEELLR